MTSYELENADFMIGTFLNGRPHDQWEQWARDTLPQLLEQAKRVPALEIKTDELTASLEDAENLLDSVRDEVALDPAGGDVRHLLGMGERLDIEEAAQLLNVSPRVVQIMLSKGQIKPDAVGTGVSRKSLITFRTATRQRSADAWEWIQRRTTESLNVWLETPRGKAFRISRSRKKTPQEYGYVLPLRLERAKEAFDKGDFDTFDTVREEYDAAPANG